MQISSLCLINHLGLSFHREKPCYIGKNRFRIDSDKQPLSVMIGRGIVICILYFAGEFIPDCLNFFAFFPAENNLNPETVFSGIRVQNDLLFLYRNDQPYFFPPNNHSGTNTSG